MAGPTAVDYGQAQGLVNQQKQDFSSLLNQQNATSQGLFNQYTAASNAQPKLVDVLNNAQQQAGIGGLQQGINLFNSQLSGTKGLIDNLNTDTQARTAGTNANQAYLDRMRASEGGQLNTQLSRLTTGLGDVTNAFNTANTNTGQLLSATQADQATALHPLELQINAMSDQFARQISGYTFGAQNELNTLLDKLKNQQDLNTQEWARANALADQETQFQQARSLAAQAANDRASAFAGLNGGSSATPGKADPYARIDKNGAAASVAALIKTNDVGRINQEYNAIQKSAGYGNTFDQYKLGLLNSAMQPSQTSAYNPTIANLLKRAISYKPSSGSGGGYHPPNVLNIHNPLSLGY